MFPKEIEKICHLNFDDLRGNLSVVLEGPMSSNSIALKRSLSNKNVFRGMHYQKSNSPQTKYVEVISGKIIDFVMCMNPLSKDYGKIYSEIITPGTTVRIPGDYAHGFYCMEETLFQYITDGKYSETDEIVISLEHERLAKHNVNVQGMIVSDKDSKGTAYADYF